MSVTFDNVIGYSPIKTELRQICDMIHHPECYEPLGARCPRGVMLHGDPGLGKTLLAQAFMSESGLKSYTLRCSKSSEEFLRDVETTFREAAENAPSVVLLDDIDKFAAEERNSEEYVVIQARMDEVRDRGVFIIATANDLGDLPDSLLRSGRFDRKIELHAPDGKDAEMIIRAYLSRTAAAAELNVEDAVRMLSGDSCADIEAVFNEAAVYAGFARARHVGMEHLLKAYLRTTYGAENERRWESEAEREATALHEAGHAAMLELLQSGSVGLVSINCSGSDCHGFVKRCRPMHMEERILVSLAGKAACELRYGKPARGCEADINSAVQVIACLGEDCGQYGVSALLLGNRRSSEDALSDREAVERTLLERYLYQAKEYLAENREFVEAIRDELLRKSTLLYSDMQAIRSRCRVAEKAA